MLALWHNLGHGAQGILPLVEEVVGYGEPRIVERLIAIEDNVDVDGACGILLTTGSAYAYLLLSVAAKKRLDKVYTP